MNDQEELDFRFAVEIEGEEACSGSLIITKDLKHCQLFEFKAVYFNHDSAVVLPEALREIVCCYLFAMENPSKLVLIAGHADKSGKPLYNDWISLRRAENVLNILLGDRAKWIESVTTTEGPIQKPEEKKKVTPTYQPKGKSKVEDYQTILKWAAKKYGWLCDPGDIDKTNNRNWNRYAREPKNINALKSFQDEYGKKFSKSITEDDLDYNIGPKTWGAFFDLYMLELAELLGHSDTSHLENYRNGLKFVDDRKIICGGEVHARSRFSRSKRDRRVHIMFFDPVEKPELKHYPFCHEPSENAQGHTTLGQIYIRKYLKKAKRCEFYGKPGIYGKDFLTCDLDHILYIEVLDCEEEPMSGVKVIIEHEVEENGDVKKKEYHKGSTNANGVLIVRGVPKGIYFIRVDIEDENLDNPKGFLNVEEQVEIFE